MAVNLKISAADTYSQNGSKPSPQTASEASALTLQTHLFYLTLILLLGAVLRIVNLGDQPLWADEGFSAFAITQPDLIQALVRDVHPPLYFAGLKAWAGLAGISEFALRWFTIMPSMVSIALMVPLAREIGRLRPVRLNPIVPVVAALLMALAEMEFYIAQEVRSYSLHVMLVMLVMLVFLRWARTGARLSAAVWVISLTALVYTHYLGAWIGVVQGIYALLFLRGRTRITAVGLLLIPAALIAGWVLTVVLPYQTVKADADLTIDQSNLETLVWYARSYLTQQWPLMLGLFILGLIGIKEGKIRIRPVNVAVLLILWIIVPVMLTYIGNLRFSIMTYYRISQITPAFVLAWAFGLSAFSRVNRLFLVAVIVVYGVMSVDFYRPKFPEPQFARMASEFAVPGDLVLMDMKGVDFSLQYYLQRQLLPGVGLESLRQTVEWARERFDTELVPALAAADTVWVSRWNDMPLGLDLMRSFGHVQTAHRVMLYGDSILEAYRFDKLPDGDGDPIAAWRNSMTLRQVEIHPDLLRVDLWWSAENALARDFTTSAILLDEAGALVAQYDSMPFLNERPTTTWETGEVIYDPKPMQLIGRDTLAPGTYQVAVQIYALVDGAPQNVRTVERQQWVVVGTLTR